jgi:hypothetical protein
MQRDHTAKADVDELEVLHDESNRALFWIDYRVTIGFFGMIRGNVRVESGL